MSSPKSNSPEVSRRAFITTSTVAAAGLAIASRPLFGAAASASVPSTPNAAAVSNYAKALVEAYGRPNSKLNGVQVGTITYSFRALPSSAEELLKYCVILGISSVELMGAPAESYITGVTGGGGRGGLPGATPEQTAA